MRGETSSKVLAVGLENHHQTAAEQVDIHSADAGLPQAGQDLWPNLPVMLTIGLNCRRITLQVDGEHGARYHPCPGALFHTSEAESKAVWRDCVYFSVKVWFLLAPELV